MNADRPHRARRRPGAARMSPTEAARLYAYTLTEGPCPCGQKRGHTGWLVCALQDPPKTQAQEEHE
jgi:hypothetical protein